MTATLILLVSSLVSTALCVWYERRPKVIGEPRMFPSTIVMMLSVVMAVLALAHLVTLITGVPLKGRGSL